MTHVERYYAKKTPYYSRTSPRGQITIPKALRDYWKFGKSQFVKMIISDTGILLEPVVGIVAKGGENTDSDSEKKDLELVEAERADLNNIYNRLTR